MEAGHAFPEYYATPIPFGPPERRKRRLAESVDLLRLGHRRRKGAPGQIFRISRRICPDVWWGPDMLYRDRVVDGELGEHLEAAGVVLIEVPKACGKAETALRVVKSSVLVDIDMQARQDLAVDPSLVLEGPTRD